MESTQHDLVELFDQLGLPSDPAAIGRFIGRHHPMPSGLKLCEAAFWSGHQALFLREMTQLDADWAPLVDGLYARLSGPPEPH